MALLSVIDASGMDGANITFAAASAGGDTTIGGAGVHLIVRNGGGSPVTVTLVTPEVFEGSLAVADRDVPVAAGAIREIPLPSRYNGVGGLAAITYSSTTSVTVAAVRGSLRTAGITIGAVLEVPPPPLVSGTAALTGAASMAAGSIAAWFTPASLAVTATRTAAAQSTQVTSASLAVTATRTATAPTTQTTGASLAVTATRTATGPTVQTTGASCAVTAAVSAVSLGGAYPDASNTGVPAGTSLTLFNTDFTTSSNGQVVNQLDIRGSLIINHTGVVVTKCKVSQWSIYGVDCESGHSMTMTDCTIDGGVNPGTCIVNNNFTLLRCDIKGAENGLDVGGDVDIRDCFFHDLYNDGADPHADCIQINDGADNIVIKHNTFLSYGADGSETTSCIISPQAATGVSNWLIEDNVFAGGAFALYGPQNGAGTSITIKDNKFWRLLHAGSAGAFGDWTDCTDETISGNQFGTFSGGYNSTTKLISGTWSGTPLP